MEPELILKCQEAPALWPLYKKAIFSKRKGMRKGEQIPSLAAEWTGAVANPEKLNGYREVCGAASDGKLPIMYPQVMTSGVQLALMGSTKFPFRLLGLVHQRNRVLQHRAIGDAERMDVYCRTGESRVVKQGLEFDMLTLVKIDGELAWEAISTYLTRGRFGEPGEPPAGSRLPDLENATETVRLAVAGDMGRRYAKVSGDYNPIHISSLLAPLFGFKRSIIHGMWSAAASIARLPGYAPTGPVRYDLAFKGPIFNGSKVEMRIADQCGGRRFDMFCANNPRPCVCGLVREGDAAEPLS
jgi:hypothetical protein